MPVLCNTARVDERVQNFPVPAAAHMPTYLHENTFLQQCNAVQGHPNTHQVPKHQFPMPLTYVHQFPTN